MNGGRPGVLHGNRTYLLQDEDGQILEGHSISAGLDYPGVGPGAFLAEGHRPRDLRARSPTRRRWKPSSSARSSKASFRRSSRRTRWRTSCKLAPTLPKDNLLVMNMCGRGDKDLHTVMTALGMS